jgi:signal transduction histidine kinase
MFNTALRKPNENIKAEFRLRHKDGSYRYMEAVCKNLLDDFRIEGIIAHYRDITERHLLEKQKDQFIGIASHELKTPVTSIKGYAQVLEQLFTESEDKKALELIKKMDGQINRLTTLIKDLLDVTQITEGQLKLKKESFDMNELITEVTDEIQQVTLKHKLVKELQPLDKIVADKEKTRQVLVNFISNAIKYSPNADTVIISSSGDGEAISVSVQDFGIGIAEATQPKIFDRFFRDADPSINTYPGLGLGLYIAAEIVKKQGGKITLKSTKNVGSAFTFSLPVKGVS